MSTLDKQHTITHITKMTNKDIKRIEYLLACAKAHQANLSPHIAARASAIHLAGLIDSVEKLLHARHSAQLLEIERLNNYDTR